MKTNVLLCILLLSFLWVGFDGIISPAQSPPPIDPIVRDLRQSGEGVVEIQPTPTPVNVRKLLAENQALRTQMSDLIQSGAEAEDLRAQNDSLKQEMSKLASKVLELDQMKEEQAAAVSVQDEIQALEKELGDKENELRSLRVQAAGSVETASKLMEARAEIERLGGLESELNQTKASLASAQSENEQLKQRLATLEQSVTDLSESQKRIDQLSAEVSSLREEKEALLQEARDQSQFLKQQVETLKLKNEAFKEGERSRQELLKQVQELQERTRVLEETKQEIAKLRMEIDQLQTPAPTAAAETPPSNQAPTSEVVSESPEIVGTPVVEEPIPKNSPSESAESDSQSGQDAGFTRYQNDSSREALEERIREEIERRRAYQQNQQ